MTVNDHYIECNGHIVALSCIERKLLKKALCKIPHAQESRDSLCPECAVSLMRRWFRDKHRGEEVDGLLNDALRAAVHYARGSLLKRCLEVAARQPWFHEEYRRYLDSTDRDEDIETAGLWVTSYTRCPYIWKEEDTNHFMMVEEYWLNDQPSLVSEILARAPLISALLHEDHRASILVSQCIEGMDGGLHTVFRKGNKDYLTTILALIRRAVSHGVWAPGKVTRESLLDAAERSDLAPKIRLQVAVTLDKIIPKWRTITR